VLWCALLVLALESVLERGIADLKAGRFEQAEQALSRAVEQQPDSADAHHHLGVLYLQTGRFDRAAASLARAVKLAPERARSWKALGAAYAAKGDFPAAEGPFRRACELDPAEEAACYYLGRNLYAQNRFSPAVEVFQTALKHEAPANAWRSHRGLALAFEALGQAQDAEQHFLKAIRLSRGRARAEEDPRVDHGVFLMRQGRTVDALPPLEAAVKSHPSSPRARFELGRALAQFGRLDAAVIHLREAVEQDARHWAAHLLLGRTLLRLGRAAEAQPHLAVGSKGASEQESGVAR
jgi:Flp pilus assembly protein TadD